MPLTKGDVYQTLCIMNCLYQFFMKMHRILKNVDAQRRAAGYRQDAKSAKNGGYLFSAASHQIGITPLRMKTY
jgi:hypothetical protein